jgi:hypothetical protein
MRTKDMELQAPEQGATDNITASQEFHDTDTRRLGKTKLEHTGTPSGKISVRRWGACYA